MSPPTRKAYLRYLALHAMIYIKMDLRSKHNVMKIYEMLRARFPGCWFLLRRKSSMAKTDDQTKRVGPVDLSSALKHKSKLRVSDSEYKTLDEDMDLNRVKKYPEKYIRDLKRNVLTPEVREAIKSGYGKTPVVSLRSQKRTDSATKNPDPKHKASDVSHEARDGKKESAVEQTTDTSLTKSVTINEDMKQLKRIDKEKIAKLAHNLDRTLFSPGVHFLQDPRTRVYNFTPHLKKIMKIDDFNFDAIEGFVSVSKDNSLLEMAQKHDRKFYSSTSSMTSLLMQFYLFLNNYHPKSEERFRFPKFGGYSERAPSSVIIQPKGKSRQNNDLIYSIESDKSADTEILLSAMGHCLEAVLTTEAEEFSKYLKKNDDAIIRDDDGKQAEEKSGSAYNYAAYSDFLMRSQLDCYDERLPGNGTFDLKTRAVCAIRYDVRNPNLENNAYQVWKLNGNIESFEREYHDLIRTGAMLKYGFQARIGQMDGIFVAYHNLNSFFGFQYFPLSEIDKIFYSNVDEEEQKHISTKKIDDIDDTFASHVAETQFKMSLEVWEALLKKVIEDINQYEEFKDSAFRLVMKSKNIPSTKKQRLHISVVPLNEKQVSILQNFPSTFRTSFREDIAPEQRYLNLSDHRVKLNKFNEETTASTMGVLNYYIDDKHFFGYSPYPVKDEHPYPRNKSQKWKLKFKITRAPNGPDQYLQFLSSATESLTGGYEKDFQNSKRDSCRVTHDTSKTEKRKPRGNVYRVYSAIGKARAKKWKERDSNPIIYQPK